MKENTNIEKLIERYIQNECTEKEVGEIISFFHKEENLQHFPGVIDVLDKIKDKPEVSDQTSDKIFSNILSIASEKDYQSARSVKKSTGVWKYAVAAMFIGLFCITYFFNQHTNTSLQQIKPRQDFITLQLEDGRLEVLTEGEEKRILDDTGNLIGSKTGNQIIYQPRTEVHELRYNTIIVPYGKKFQIQLSDGTNVHLNSGTSLKYPVQFIEGEKREVFLTGEAFFDVARDESHPFVVNADKLNVQVLGTKFNVSSYAEDFASEVVLVEGSVGMFPDGKNLKSEKSLYLKPGFKGSFDKKSESMVDKKVVPGIYTSWINGELVFRNMAFGNILRKLERHYNLDIENENLALENETFNANFGNEPIEKVLEYLKTMYGIEYSIRKNKVVIK